MSAASSIAIERTGASRLAAMASRPLAVALAITALITVLRLSGTVDSDVAWQLWIAGRIHAGANLYTDIVETNPPLWFWMAVPIDSIASVLHARIESVLIVAIACLAALSVTATDQLIDRVSAKRRALLLSYAALILLVMPWVHLGQREQIVLIGTVPYAALLAARREGRRVSPLVAALVGTGAALSFALKHYFLIVPALLELWLLAGRRAGWRAFRPETAAVAIVGLFYLAAVVAFEQDYLTNIVPLVRLAYGLFGPPTALYLFGPLAVLGLVTICFLGAHHRLVGRAPLAAALSISAIGFTAAYFVQFKGWPYHAIPLVGCASLALAALLVETKVPTPVLRTVAPTLLLFPLLIAAVEARNGVAQSADLQRAISGLREGDSVGFLTENTAVPWSVTLQHRFRYPSRYNGYWMLSAVYASEARRKPDPRLESLGREIVRETATDFRCLPPRRIIVARPTRGTWTEHTVDILPFFMRDPAFADLLAHYRPLGRTTFDVYELSRPLAPLPAAQCRHGM
jgi:hypothetical protein